MFVRWLRDISTLVLLALASAASANPNLPVVIGVDHLNIYGTTVQFARDSDVPGGGIVRAKPRSAPGEEWTSGTAVALPFALEAGERVSAFFWARAERPGVVTATLHGGSPDYTSLAETTADLAPRWQRFVISGIAPANLAAGSQFLTVNLGKVQTEVTLGPVMFARGKPDEGQINAAFEAFRPESVAVDLSIRSDPGVLLAGTLRTPVGHSSAPLPLAIIIGGHGPYGRGGAGQLMDRLLADGIATLEYDKRGIGQSTGTYTENVDALTRDASAAVAAMRRRPQIDGSRIAIVGHSEGAAIAPAVAAADPKIAAIVNVAGGVGDGLDMFGREMAAHLVTAGHSASAVEPVTEAVKALFRARIHHAADASIASLKTAVISGFMAIGFTHEQAAGALAALDIEENYRLAQTHIASDLKSLRIPVLYMFGSLDPIILTATNAPAARAALADNPAGKVVVFDGLSHWFQEGAKSGTEQESTTLGPSLSSPRAIALIGDWLDEYLHPARSVSGSDELK